MRTDAKKAIVGKSWVTYRGKYCKVIEVVGEYVGVKHWSFKGGIDYQKSKYMALIPNSHE